MSPRGTLATPTKLRFEERTRDLEVLHAWVDADQIETSLDTLASRGFVFGANGQVFVTGSLPFDLHDETPRRLILCQIGVGRSFVQDEVAGADGKRLPDGYDSIFLARPQEETSGAGYRHEYLLFDASQALPMYLVQYVPGISDGSDRNKRLLEWPGSATAPPSVAVEALYDRYDFFDPVWYVPVSVRDKMVGSHSTGEASMHKLIGIGDAYDAALNESLKPDPILVQRQNEIKAQMRAIDGKLRDVNRNSAEVEERIYKALQDALFQLQDLTQQKMNALLSEEVELRRQLQHIEWIESFLDRQRDEANQVDFLNAWKCHVQLRGDLCRGPIRTAELLQNVQADLDFEGSFRVISRNGPQQDLRLMNKASASRTPGVKRRQSNGDSPGHRRGSGSMTLTGTPSPVQDVSAIMPTATNATPMAPSTSTALTAQPDLDVSRAFIEPLRQQKESLAKETMGGDSSAPGSGGLGRNMEVPPTPPAIRKSKRRPLGRGPSEYLQFSMTAEANRKVKQLGSFPHSDVCFNGSRLVSNQAPPPLPDDKPGTEGEEKAEEPALRLSDAQILFLSLPVPVRSRVELLFATWREDNPSIQGLVHSIPTQQIVIQDGENTKTVEVPEYIQTVLLVKANGRVFGGFASDPWRDDGEFFGTAKCFLFSMDNDVKIPFVGKETLPVSKAMQDFYKERGMPVPKFSVLTSDMHHVQFGVGDLVLANNFREGASELEHSFGIGLNPENGEAESFLAGGPRFVCDAVELWAIRS